MAVRYSLLDIVQKTLSAMDSDEVNSTADTPESRQVADNAEIVYNDLILTADLPEQFQFYSLTATTDANIPIVMYRPSPYETMEWLKYKRTTDEDVTQRTWTLLKPISIGEYLNRSDGLNPDDENVARVEFGLEGTTLEIFYYTDRSPTVYTSFDDRTLLFNSIDLEVDDTLQNSKTLAYGLTSTQFILSDFFQPSFDSSVHQLWLNETIALCQSRMRQVQDPKAEKSARKNWIKLQDDKQAVSTGSYYDKYPNYSRKP